MRAGKDALMSLSWSRCVSNVGPRSPPSSNAWETMLRADSRFERQPKSFWADVRTIGELVGYSTRNQGTVRVPTTDEVKRSYGEAGLQVRHLFHHGSTTEAGDRLFEYLEHRAQVLNQYVEPRLMDLDQARNEFEILKDRLAPTCPLPMNKQKGPKRAPAYLTGIVNMLVEAHSAGHSCDYDPRRLTKVTRDGAPLRTLSRRVDGAFPSVVDPVAIWEIKEYYHTTTFGSRVADGVYETLLDGMELEDLEEAEGIKVRHYLFVDSHYTWWRCGRSYLCRMVDMVHMGYVDEVCFGYETIERLPALVVDWGAELTARGSDG